METLLRIVADKFRTVEANEAFLAATCQMKIEDAKSQLFLINASMVLASKTCFGHINSPGACQLPSHVWGNKNDSLDDSPQR